MDLTSTWQIATPSLSGLPQPSGPPNVSLGYLWNSYDSLYLYGGEFSSKPTESPTAFSMWEYQLASSQWIEHENPTTSGGNNSEASGQAVQRAAEGAGVAVPSLGRGWYFGGHQDPYTTEGWSQSIWRIYLKSLLEFTFPGFSNDQVSSLSDGQTAGTDGVWRNITEGGSQDTAGFPERADGLLLYSPGFGAEGILLGLAGGTNETLTQMNVIDVYDIASSTWYKQATSGSIPDARVNPCAVVAAAPDGSSYNVYMFGGQDLANNQTQLNDMWILTIPSFTWIEVDQKDQSVPYARAGHTCHLWDAQMIVVGGYVGEELSCDSPGIYVYDASALTWVEQFTALSNGSSSSASSSSSSSADASSSGSATASGDSAGSSQSAASDSGSATASADSASSAASSSSSSSTFVSNSETNPLNQQPAQLANGTTSGGLEGSYGYQVPEVVFKVIGGTSTGGATVTEPSVTATAGPLATGKPITYTVTQSNGATTTETSGSGSGSGGNGSSGGNSSSGGGGPNIAAIVAGTIAGILFIIVCYLGFCAWLYRKQLVLYKRHVEMAQRQALGEKRLTIPGLITSGEESGKTSSERRALESAGISSASGGNSASGSGGNRSGRSNNTGATVINAPRNGSGTASLLPRTSNTSNESAEDVEDLLGGQEPTFLGVMLAPRRSLRVINRD